MHISWDILYDYINRSQALTHQVNYVFLRWRHDRGTFSSLLAYVRKYLVRMSWYHNSWVQIATVPPRWNLLNRAICQKRPVKKEISRGSGGCFTNVSRALQNDLAKIYIVRNNISVENFKLKLCTRAQSMDLGTRTKFELEILISTILVIYKFRGNVLESSRNFSETPPRGMLQCKISVWNAS